MHRPSGPMLSISQNVCLSVCPSVCMFTFEVPFKCLLAPLHKVECPKFLEPQKPWEKVMERSGFRFENFFLIKGVKSPHKKVIFRQILLTEQDFLVLVFLTHFNGLLTTLPEVKCANFLDFGS